MTVYDPYTNTFYDNSKKQDVIATNKTVSYDTTEILSEIEKFTRLQREQKEQTLAEIITKYDFIVGSKEVKFKLMEILPEGATIISSPYIENPTTVYAIKKFDMTDLLY